MSTPKYERYALPVGLDLAFPPSELNVPKYCLPHALGDSAAEEVAARLLVLSQEVGLWTGITWRELLARAQEDVRLHAHRAEVRATNARLTRIYNDAVVRHRFLNISTIGIYGCLIDPPQLRLVDVPEGEDPMTMVYMFGPELLVQGMNELKRRNLILTVVGDRHLILYPTPRLLDILLRRGFVRL